MTEQAYQVSTPNQPLNNKPTSESEAYRVKRLREEGKHNTADLLESPPAADLDEQISLYRENHPNAPGDREYDWRRAFEDGAVSNEPGNTDGGMHFLPEEYYRGSRTFSVFNYDQASDSQQFMESRHRIGAYAVKGFAQSVAETIFVDPIAEPLTQIQEQAKHGDGKTVPEIVGYDKFGAEIWMDVPVNPVQVTPEQIQTTSDALRAYTMPESIGKLDLDDDETLGGLAEGMVGILAEMGLDIWATRGAAGGTIFKRKKAVDWYRKAINRFKEVGDPTTILGELLFAKSPNPDNKGTVSSALGEALEEEMGMEGELIEWLKSTDDTPLSQAVSITIESLVGMELLRGMALGGYKATGMKAAVNFIADQMKEAERLLGVMNVSMGGVPFKAPEQEFTSAATSINKTRMAAPFKKIPWEEGTTNVDIGGGKFDNATQYLTEKNVTNHIYDPFNRSAEHNENVMALAFNGQSDTATVNNVLNVIQEPGNRAEVIQQAHDAIKQDGKAYFSVYEGNGSGTGAQSSKDGYQNNRKLKDYMDEILEIFPQAEMKNGMIIATKEGGLPPGRISTRFPRAVNATENPLTQDLRVGLESSLADPKQLEHNVNLMRRYDNFGDLPEDPAEAAEVIIEKGKQNLLRLFDDIPEKIRERSKQWYVGARKLAEESAQQYGISPESASAVYAALSPQKDWFMNVSLGNRVMDIVTNKSGAKWDDAMDTTLDRLTHKINDAKGRAALRNIRGKTLDELTDPIDRAAWVRTFDEANNPRSHQLITPEGEYGANVMTDKGKESGTGWGSLKFISNAVSVIDDPSMANISERMGDMHKVRNFYNNISDPESLDGAVTIDTHAVAATMFSPFSGADIPVKHNLSGGQTRKAAREEAAEKYKSGEYTLADWRDHMDYIDNTKLGVSNSAVTGNKGTYGLHAEMYRRAAAERGVLPREMQSITWEGIRGLFPKEIKQKAFKKQVREIWLKHKNGKMTLEEAQDEIIELAGGIDAPKWYE